MLSLQEHTIFIEQITIQFQMLQTSLYEISLVTF